MLAFYGGRQILNMGSVGAPPKQATIMAKRKKRATARRGKATREKASKPAKSMRGKSAKRRSPKTKSKKRTTKTTKRAGIKTMVQKVEPVVMNIVKEPLPGALVPTEPDATEKLDAIEIHGPTVSQEHSEEGLSEALPKS